MFTSFKNTELFRYFIRVDLNKSVNKLLKQNKSNFSLIAGSIFSGSFSVLGTYFGIHGNNFNSICKVILSSALFALLFVIGMGLFKFFIFICSYAYNARKKESLPSKEQIKEYIDDFDHIACDNILISQKFIAAYIRKNTSHNLKEFYFYEIIYYVKVSLSIIQKIITNKEKCINDKEHTNRIYLFRLENSIKMIDEIYFFLNSSKDNISIDPIMKSSLFKEISNIKEKTDKFNKECQQIKETIYSH